MSTKSPRTPNLHHSLVTQGGPGSVRFGSVTGVEQLERFRFSVPAVPLQKGFSVFQVSLTGRFRFRFSVSGKAVPMVPVSGSGSVSELPYYVYVAELASN